MFFSIFTEDEHLGQSSLEGQLDEDSFDPFATITADAGVAAQDGSSFDPFASIHGDDAFVAHFPETGELSGGATSGNIYDVI